MKNALVSNFGGAQTQIMPSMRVELFKNRRAKVEHVFVNKNKGMLGYFLHLFLISASLKILYLLLEHKSD
jgi:hypothetical protein